MATSSDVILEQVFPGLQTTAYELTSPNDPRYNCIAWAAEDHKRWWEPDPMGVAYWPPGVPRRYSVAAYEQAFRSIGYADCSDDTWEEGATKVALFAEGGKPTHAARRISEGRWTSKLGRSVDISHELQGITGDSYGDVVTMLRRPGVT